jgi:biotin transporter BioY
LAESGWDRRPLTTVLAMLLGNLVIYLGGLSWLAHFVGTSRVLDLGLYPFLAGDLVKLIAAAVLLPSGWKILHRLGYG